MRIAYVSLHWPRTLVSGVGKKIARQISAWTAAGHEVQFFMSSLAAALLDELFEQPAKVFRTLLSCSPHQIDQIDQTDLCAS